MAHVQPLFPELQELFQAGAAKLLWVPVSPVYKLNFQLGEW